MAPLRVRIDCRAVDSLPMLEMLFEHFPRMEEFHIRGLSAYAVRNIISKLVVPAPLLQSLQLTSLSNKRPLFPRGVPPPPVPVIFSGTTPRLRSLDLSRVNIAWNSLTEMKSLRLSSMPRPHTMQKLSSMLSQLPRLTDLELDDVLPWLSSPLQNPLTEKIKLPCLSRLCIMATIPDTVHFLSYIHVPPNAEIRLKCGFGGHASLPQLLSYVQKRFSPDEDEREVSTPKQLIRSMNVDGGTFFVTCSTSKRGYKYRALSVKENQSPDAPHSPYNYDWDRGIPLKIDLRDTFSAALTETVMISVFQHLSLSHLQSLAVYFPTLIDFSGIFWRNLFDLAQELQFIKLRYTSLGGFVITLAPDHHGWTGQNDILTARALEEIELEKVSFATDCVVDAEGLCNPGPVLQCLCGALARRRHAGYTLRRVTISDSFCVGTDDQVDRLRGVVCEVKWDGINNEHYDENLEFRFRVDSETDLFD
jgi:hypothetical protein